MINVPKVSELSELPEKYSAYSVFIIVFLIFIYSLKASIQDNVLRIEAPISVDSPFNILGYLFWFSGGLIVWLWLERSAEKWQTEKWRMERKVIHFAVSMLVGFFLFPLGLSKSAPPLPGPFDATTFCQTSLGSQYLPNDKLLYVVTIERKQLAHVNAGFDFVVQSRLGRTVPSNAAMCVVVNKIENSQSQSYTDDVKVTTDLSSTEASQSPAFALIDESSTREYVWHMTVGPEQADTSVLVAVTLKDKDGSIRYQANLPYFVRILNPNVLDSATATAAAYATRIATVCMSVFGALGLALDLFTRWRKFRQRKTDKRDQEKKNK